MDRGLNGNHDESFYLQALHFLFSLCMKRFLLFFPIICHDTSECPKEQKYPKRKGFDTNRNAVT